MTPLKSGSKIAATVFSGALAFLYGSAKPLPFKRVNPFMFDGPSKP